ANRLRDRGLGGSPVFVIPESRLDNGFLPTETVAPLFTWLRRLAGDERSREVVAMRTLGGILASLPQRALVLAAAADVQAAAADELVGVVHQRFTAADLALRKRLTDGS